MYSDNPCLLKLCPQGSPNIGYLTVAENSTMPFTIERVYWTYDVPTNTVRGGHAHFELEQLIFAVHGHIRFELEGIRGDKHVFLLESPEQGLYIPHLYWRDIIFSPGAVLMCLASQEYTEKDYIRNYAHFKALQNA